MKLLWIDPGKRVGWAFWSDEGYTVDQPGGSGIVSYEDLPDFLSKYEDIDVLGYEQYIVLRQKAEYHTGSKVEAAQAIGYLKGFAKIHGIRNPTQMSNILPMAMKMVRMKPPKGHLRDNISAWLHMVWFMHNNLGKYQTALEKESLINAY